MNFLLCLLVNKPTGCSPDLLAQENHPGLSCLKFLNFKDRDADLYLARIKEEAMKIDNVRISFYPDFSAELQRKWAKFTEVKKRLRCFDVTNAMLYPAKLRVAANDETHFFNNPAVASHWLDREVHTLWKHGNDSTGDPYFYHLI